MSTDHPVNCICDNCMDEDCAGIIEAAPHSTWTRQKLEWIRSVRSKPLNWTLEPGHCALCGGDDLNVSKQADHWIVLNHNPVVAGNILYTSILVADGGSWSATYREFTKKGKDALKVWARIMVGAQPMGWPGRPASTPPEVSGIAVRKIEHWTEIRIGLKDAA